MLVEALFRRVFKFGEVELIDPSGRRTRYGSPPGPPRRRPAARPGDRSPAGGPSRPGAGRRLHGRAHRARWRATSTTSSIWRRTICRTASRAGARHPGSAPSSSGCATSISATPGAVGPQRRAPLRPFRRAVRPVPGQRAPVHLRLPPHRHRGSGDRAAARRSGTSRPSCASSPACACWTWAAAGAASRSIWPAATMST